MFDRGIVVRDRPDKPFTLDPLLLLIVRDVGKHLFIRLQCDGHVLKNAIGVKANVDHNAVDGKQDHDEK